MSYSIVEDYFSEESFVPRRSSVKIISATAGEIFYVTELMQTKM